MRRTAAAEWLTPPGQQLGGGGGCLRVCVCLRVQACKGGGSAQPDQGRRERVSLAAEGEVAEVCVWMWQPATQGDPQQATARGCRDGVVLPASLAALPLAPV